MSLSSSNYDNSTGDASDWDVNFNPFSESTESFRREKERAEAEEEGGVQRLSSGLSESSWPEQHAIHLLC